MMVPPVFSSTEEANRVELERQQEERNRCCGILHPETGISLFYNQMHIVFLLYLMAFLPVRTAFEITPQPDDWAFWADLFIDLAIAVDIVLNFRCATCHFPEGEGRSAQLKCREPHSLMLATTACTMTVGGTTGTRALWSRTLRSYGGNTCGAGLS